MLIVMKPGATASEIDAVVNVVETVGFRAYHAGSDADGDRHHRQ